MRGELGLPMSFFSNQNWEPPKIYSCQGIGTGARCGKAATVKLSAHKWSEEKQEIEQVDIHVCPDHAKELEAALMKERRNITPNHSGDGAAVQEWLR